MTLPDVNVLLSAFRSDAEAHELCQGWLQSVVNGSRAYGISPQVLASVVRLATHPKIFRRPSRLHEVLAFCEALLTSPRASHAFQDCAGVRQLHLDKGTPLGPRSLSL